MLALADLFVWVVDPQKYADAAWHERYLRGLAAHAGVMEVVLNQADLLGDGAVEACRADLQRLLSADGLGTLPVHTLSAWTGEGVGALRAAVERRVAARSAAVERLGADVAAAVARVAEACEGVGAGGVTRAHRDRLVAALAEAAGVPTVVRAVERAHRHRGALATGWPATRSLRRLRPDPLRRLRLPDRGDAAAAPPSLPEPTAVQRAGVATAARALAAAAAGDLADPWPRRVREVATAQEGAATERLAATLGAVALRMSSPRWWRAAGLVQRGMAAVAAAGALWLLALLVLAWLRVDDLVPTPEVEGIAVPTLLALGGALAGLLIALAARLVNGSGARRRARRAERALRARVAETAGELVVGPVEAELAARARLCRAVALAPGDGPAAAASADAPGSRIPQIALASPSARSWRPRRRAPRVGYRAVLAGARSSAPMAGGPTTARSWRPCSTTRTRRSSSTRTRARSSTRPTRTTTSWTTVMTSRSPRRGFVRQQSSP